MSKFTFIEEDEGRVASFSKECSRRSEIIELFNEFLRGSGIIISEEAEIRYVNEEELVIDIEEYESLLEDANKNNNSESQPDGYSDDINWE